MKYLLDTHTQIWFASNDSRLSLKTKKIIEDENNEIYFSKISLWEIAIKFNLGKLNLKIPLEEYLKEYIQPFEIQILDLKTEHILLLGPLPFHHQDPFDRLLACQSRFENMPFLTSDKSFLKYDIEVIE